jgi:hypothetical protein
MLIPLFLSEINLFDVFASVAPTPMRACGWARLLHLYVYSALSPQWAKIPKSPNIPQLYQRQHSLRLSRDCRPYDFVLILRFRQK